MASVTKEVRRGRTLYRIEWRDGDKKRRKLRLAGELNNHKDAKAIATKITAIVSARIARQPLENSVSQWLVQIGQELHEKLAKHGLCEPRQTAILGDFVANFIDQRSQEFAPSTVRNFRQVEKLLLQHFGKDCDMRSITEGQADSWRNSLPKKYAAATVSKHVKRTKQIFKAAARYRVISHNPFEDVKGGSETNDDRKVFIERALIDRALEAAADVQWRMIIALARYGGLRCPSEVLALKWGDIDWAGNRFTVTSPKTKRYGKGSRVVPIFPELLPILSEGYGQAKEGDEYLITRYRATNSNLRTQFKRILKHAQVTPWPRLFQNLRSSCETELASAGFSLKTVTEWLGNTPAVAHAHYLSVTEADFEKAIRGGARGGDNSNGNYQKQTESNPPVVAISSTNDEFAYASEASKCPLKDSNLGPAD